MKKLFLAAAALALALPASAADLPTKAPTVAPVYATYSWAGFYAGASGSWATSKDDVTNSGTEVIGSTVIATGGIPATMNPHADGAMFGAHAGYNWQVGQGVFGVEATYLWSNVKGSDSQTLTLSPLGLPVGLTSTTTTELDWLATLNARAGVALHDRLLVYVTGGLAVGDVTTTTTHALLAPAPFGASSTGTFSDTRWGWNLGAGLEYALGGNWRARVEYTYTDLGSGDVNHGTTLAFGGPGGTPVGFNASTDYTFHRVGGGISYRF